MSESDTWTTAQFSLTSSAELVFEVFNESINPTAHTSLTFNNESNATTNGSSDDAGSITRNVASNLAVFIFLELLAVCALLGNSVLVAVILKFNHLTKPSFVLIFNLALADMLHGTVTSSYFYPPIVIGHNHFSQTAFRLMNVVDWTAWGLTITHMSAICIDRLLAIALFHRYQSIMLVRRVIIFSSGCWTGFVLLNLLLFVTSVCCPVVPKPELYSFSYMLPEYVVYSSTGSNVYPYVYIPLEVACMLILLLCNPITLFQLYRKYRRKKSLRKASSMMLAAALGQKVNDNNAKAINRDIKIFVQIMTVTIIFFLYMVLYYIIFYVLKESWAWALFQSFFYSVTHMINPVVYFCLNDEMRRQLKSMLKCEDQSGRRRTAYAIKHPSQTAESQPLLRSCNTSVPAQMQNGAGTTNFHSFSPIKEKLCDKWDQIVVHSSPAGGEETLLIQTPDLTSPCTDLSSPCTLNVDDQELIEMQALVGDREPALNNGRLYTIGEDDLIGSFRSQDVFL